LDGQGAERECMIVEVTIHGHRLTVANVHLIHPGYDRITKRLLSAPQIARETYSMRIEQVKTTLRALSSVRTPLILCGDMNSQPKGTFYHLLRKQLTDTWDATNVGLGYSFHSKRPYARIDYIWSNTGMKPLRSKILTTQCSDHFPVLTEFIWNRD
jgi:endonuclease/exonuclease/phosphatase (EEP) superfamily protein YafD